MKWLKNLLFGQAIRGENIITKHPIVKTISTTEKPEIDTWLKTYNKPYTIKAKVTDMKSVD